MEACESPDQPNVTSYDATILAIVTLEVFAGMWINTFIVSVLCVAWIKKKSLDSNAKILLLLGFSRLWYLFFSWLYSFLLIIYPHFLYVQPTYTLILFIMNFFECSHLWVSACLCGFYCVKIANFRNSFFIYLKVKIERIVPCLLVGSLLLALANGILVYSIDGKENCNNSTGQGNFSKVTVNMDDGFLPIFFIYGFGFVTSLMAVIFSALLLLFSLWRHKRNMQTNSMKDLSVDAHIKAMKSILSFLVMYTINFISLTSTLISSMKEENPMMFLIYVFQYVFPVVHSLLLIFSNPKLEKTLLSILPCVKCKVCMR
ncbi:taste receptor type 2 member 110-like [Pithys albifrons albifrons]|uniref:taste receptor type 2 member 110-like n=1 Tax=Pithys albifrons albifrons TaxID=3385563 RepID=UPI003A5CF61D